MKSILQCLPCKLAALLALCGVATIARADLPPVTTGLVAQYDAQAISGLADGATVNTWNDTSGASNHATRTAGAPAYMSGVLNGHPVVRFPVGGAANFSFPRRTDIRTIFWVISEANTTALHFLMGDSSNYDFHRGYAAAPFKLWDGTYSSPNLRGGTTRLNGSAVNGTSTSLAAGWNLLNVVTSGNVVASYITQDRVYGRQWEGDIAEILIYNSALSGADVAAVEGYLNAKWFTPANTVANPVISPAGGSYIGAGTATLTCATPGATIYYTTDGTTPTNTSPSGASGLPVPIPAGATTTVRAYGHLDTWTDSAVSSATYTTTTTSSGVWINPVGGSWTTDTNWQGGTIPAGGTADFSTLDLTADTGVTLDGATTVSNLIFGDMTTPSHNWAITAGTGGTLTLEASWTAPTITVNNQTATLASVVAGDKGLVKAGLGLLVLTGANTYTGATSVNAGTLRVTDLASHRSPVTIASGATFEANLATNVNAPQSFNITGSGTLKKTGAGYWLIGYTGRVGIAMGAGGLLDIQEGTVGTGSHQQSFTGNQGSLAIASGATLDISAENVWFDGLSGDGSIIMSYTASGARTVTLGVANGGGTFGGVIGSGGYISLTKTGSGTQVLTGSNTYTGTTTINGGTLRVNGSITSPVTVNANGSLAGSGTVSGTVSGAGTLAPGSAGTGTLSTGALTLTGTYACQLDGANSDKLAVTGGLTLTNATLALSTLNAPTAASYVIASYTTGTAPAFTTVTGMPAGYVVDMGTAGQIKLVSNPMYATWGASKGLTAANGSMTQNPDGDGYNNLMEYGFATDPLVSASGAIAYANGAVSAHGQPTTSVTNTTNGVDYRAVFGRRKDYVAAGLTYTVQFSVDMAEGSWVDSTATPEVLASDTEIDAVSVPYPFFIPTARGAEKPTFFRVAVSSNP